MLRKGAERISRETHPYYFRHARQSREERGCGSEKRGEEGKRGLSFQKAQTEHGENALKVEGRVRRTALNEGRIPRQRGVVDTDEVVPVEEEDTRNRVGER